MEYFEFRDVMLAKGYTVIDVFDCIRDFYRSDACSKFNMDIFNEYVALFCDHIMDRFAREKKHYDIDDAFNKLIDKFFTEDFSKNRSVDDVFDDLCWDVWDHCDLGLFVPDDYWQDILKDC